MRSMPPSVASQAAIVVLAAGSPARTPAGAAKAAMLKTRTAARPMPRVMRALSRAARAETSRQRAGERRLPGPSSGQDQERLGVRVLEFRHGLQAVLGRATHDDLVDLALVVGVDHQLVIGDRHEMVAHTEEAANR